MATISVAQISKLAKRIRKPGEKWTNAISRASKQLKNGKRQTDTSNQAADVKRKAKAPGKRKSKSGATYYERRKNRSDKPGSLTGGNKNISRYHTDYNRPEVNISIGSLKSQLVKKMEDQMARLFIQKENAKTKRDRNRIQKEISANRRELKKYKTK